MNDETGEVPPVRSDGLQLSEDRRFQERFWRAERLALCVFALVVLLALSGMFGAGGPLSVASTASPSARIEYPRVTRWATEDQIVVHFDSDRPVHRLLLGGSFLDWFHIEGINPEPMRMVQHRDDVRLEFAAGEEDGFQVIVRITAERPGLARFTAAFDEGGPSDLTSVVLP
jgi:hypothetical protein